MTDGPPPDSLCLLPWLNLSLDVDGTSRPCCKFEREHAGGAYAFANLADASLAEVWNSEGMQRLRADFLAGERPTGCSACWDEEAAGVRSFRQSYLDDRRIRARPDPTVLTPAAPVALDLKLSNACNLKCRICGPTASSLWLNEELKHRPEGNPTRVYLEANKDFFRANKITDRAGNLDEIRGWVADLESLEMTGGEPMLSKENRQIIELVTTEGHPERVALTLTTNGTVIDDRVMSALPAFGEVVISLSIDDIGARLEYQRAPANWDEVDRNLDRYAALASPTCQVFTNTTISTLNVWYLPEYLTWIHERFPGREIEPNLNLVHGPRHFCIQVLPRELKELVDARLRAAAAGPWASHIREKVTGIADFMMSADEPDHGAYWAGIAELRKRDAIRGEAYELAHPEWFAELDARGWWEPTPPARSLIDRVVHRRHRRRTDRSERTP